MRLFPSAAVLAVLSVVVRVATAQEVGLEAEYEPLLSTDWEGRTLQLSFSLAERGEGVSDFPIDRDGTRFAPAAALDTQIRLGARLNTEMSLAPARIVLEYEHDLLTGIHAGGIDDRDLGVDLPSSDGTATELRKAYAQLDYTESLHLFGGFMMSHWGLGLVANDGDHGWAPGNAQLSDPRSGDRMLRGLVAVGPLTALDVLVSLGYDVVQDDDITLPGDEARQFIGALTFGYDQPTQVGLYGVVRRQDASDGGELAVQALDLYGRYDLDLGQGRQLRFETEAVYVWGRTDLGPSVDFPDHDVQQFAAAGRVGLDLGRYGSVLDILYASGDADADDGTVSAFKADPNYSMGLLLFPVVLAAQTARAPITAANLDLVGQPSEDLDRIPTRGSASNTIAFFPKAWWAPIAGLEVYGGALFALSEVPLADPFNTRIAGGQPRNALDGVPGRYLGTELDLGVRYRHYFGPTELTAGLEGGALFPGNAFRTADGGTLDTVAGGRLMLRYRF